MIQQLNVNRILVITALLILSACSDKKGPEKDSEGFNPSSRDEKTSILHLKLQSQATVASLSEIERIILFTLQPELQFHPLKNCLRIEDDRSTGDRINFYIRWAPANCVFLNTRKTQVSGQEIIDSQLENGRIKTLTYTTRGFVLENSHFIIHIEQSLNLQPQDTNNLRFSHEIFFQAEFKKNKKNTATKQEWTFISNGTLSIDYKNNNGVRINQANTQLKAIEYNEFKGGRRTPLGDQLLDFKNILVDSNGKPLPAVRFTSCHQAEGEFVLDFQYGKESLKDQLTANDRQFVYHNDNKALERKDCSRQGVVFFTEIFRKLQQINSGKKSGIVISP